MANVFLETHGCSANFSESEAMTGMLQRGGFNIAQKPEESDVVVLNLCTVKGEGTALRAIRKAHEAFPDKKFVYAGCLTSKLVTQIKKNGYKGSLINTNNIHKIHEVVSQTLSHNHIEALAKIEEGSKVGIPRIRRNPVVGIVQILSGCSSFCSFCSVKLIKKRLISYPMEDIIEEVERAVKEGCREIWLTSQDNGAYMVERGLCALPKLVRKITRIKGDFRIRIGMLSPKTLKPMIEEMSDVYKEDKVFKFLHLPVQAGNNEVLKDMRRGNTIEEFKEMVRKFRAEIPDLTVSTDIIAGFPTETEERFNDTLQLIKEMRFDIINVSRFVPREGTTAAALSPLPGGIVKERSRKVTELFHKIAEENNKRWLGWKGEIVIDEKGKHDTWVGRNYTYKPVVVKGSFKLGDTIMVKIASTAVHDLRGEVIEPVLVKCLP